MADDEGAVSGLGVCGVAGVWVIFGGSSGGPMLPVLTSGKGRLRGLLSELPCLW